MKNYVENELPAGYAKNVIGHSMGNMLLSSALYPRTNTDGSIAPGMTVSNVIFMQAAVPASCYDSDAATLSGLTTYEGVHPTPDDFTHMGYRGLDATNINATLYNIYNANDFALGWWVTSQELNKPQDLWHPLEYALVYYSWASATGGSLNNWAYDTADGSFDWPGSQIRTVTDPQESMPYIARSRTAALGTEETVGSIESGNNFNAGAGSAVNLGATRLDRSGEFTRPIQQLNAFYLYIFDHVQ